MESVILLCGIVTFLVAFSVPVFLLANSIRRLDGTIQNLQNQNEIRFADLNKKIEKEIEGLDERVSKQVDKQQKTINGIRDVLIKNQLTDAGKV